MIAWLLCPTVQVAHDSIGQREQRAFAAEEVAAYTSLRTAGIPASQWQSVLAASINGLSQESPTACYLPILQERNGTGIVRLILLTPALRMIARSCRIGGSAGLPLVGLDH
jgi:hypothetical protein